MKDIIKEFFKECRNVKKRNKIKCTYCNKMVQLSDSWKSKELFRKYGLCQKCQNNKLFRAPIREAKIKD